MPQRLGDDDSHHRPVAAANKEPSSFSLAASRCRARALRRTDERKGQTTAATVGGKTGVRTITVEAQQYDLCRTFGPLARLLNLQQRGPVDPVLVLPYRLLQNQIVHGTLSRVGIVKVDLLAAYSQG